MEYQKTNVNAFLGLDNNQRPELIKNEEASDIENLRFDKLGYLINRNGALSASLNMERSVPDVEVSFPGLLYPIGAMGISEYVIEKPWGIGSGSAAVHPYDDATLNFFSPTQAGQSKHTDRFMVYAVRIPAHRSIVDERTDENNQTNLNNFGNVADMDNPYTWRYKAAYLLVPLTGPSGWRDAFAFAPNGYSLDNVNYKPVDATLPTLYATIGSRSIVRADDKLSRTQIYAPARWLGVHNQFSSNGVPKDLNWIEHYVTMQQYREAIVISDMTNGDMFLVDEYMESEYQDEKKHRFTLRENALAHFNVDDVVIDFGIGGFNEGVKAPMALYKFYLTRNRFQPTQDNYIPYYSGAEESPRILSYRSDIRFWNMGDVQSRMPSVFIATEYWKSDVSDAGQKISACGIRFDTTRRYTFTSHDESGEYDDLLAPLTLQNPDIDEDDQVATDVYLWKDMEIQYFPSSGVAAAFGNYLTAQDRTWNKTSSSGTKLIKLKTREGVEQQVPLGVWRYRFVWYMGNGEYSAPSSELLVPDLLFSGVQDSDIIASYGSYLRPIGIRSFNDAEKTSLPLVPQNPVNPNSLSPTFLNEGSGMQGIQMFSTSVDPILGTLVGDLNAYGRNFVNVKRKILSSSHTFAARYSSTNGSSWPTNWTNESLLAKGQVTVVCTLMWQNNYIPLAGVAVETAKSVVDAFENDADGTYDYGSSLYESYQLPLYIPLFPDENASHTYNSVFTYYGVLRTAYQNVSRNVGLAGNQNFGYSANHPAYQIVFEGAQRYGADNDYDGNGGAGFTGSDVILNGKGVWFNVIPYRGGLPELTVPTLTNLYIEYNNKFDDLNPTWAANPLNPPTHPLWWWRNMTSLRGVREEADRVLSLEPNLPAEVTTRMVLSGSAEITLCNFGDIGTWSSQRKYYVSNVADEKNNLLYDTRRAYLPVGQNIAVDLYAFGNPFPNVNDDYRQFINAPNLVAPNVSGGTLQFSNLRVVLTGKGERLTIPEQLSMYVPASLLFEAPHVKIVIPTNRIPRRARQLLIFRTRASHDNAWQPHEYGLVKSLDIKRTASGTISVSDYPNNRLEFLDDVKSSELDYSYALNDYDGFVKPIKSRFCLPLNERVFYANIKEAYKPHTPRTAVDVVNTLPADTTAIPHLNLNFGSRPEMRRLWSYRMFSDASAANPTNITNRYLYYFAAYNDQARSFSLASCSGEIDRGSDFATTKNKPVLFCMPSAYDPSVEQINVYRLSLSTPITKITLTNNRYSAPVTPGRVYFVLQGVVEYNGQIYYQNDIIKAYAGKDVGYPTSRVNRATNYFDITGDAPGERGFAGSYCQPVLYDITDYFDGSTGPQYIEKIGVIKDDDEGIFFDNDLPSLGRLPIKQIFQNEDIMPSGIRWSEPYQANKIKLASLTEVRSGDGDQITGLAMLYGNLIVLKERSIHRLAVQGATVPISRTDEISNNVGCIAPNTVITVNNTLYFLSWAGFYKYDNNTLSKIDGNFSEELQLRLRSTQNGVINPAIRDASCGWNPTFRELYLTIPVMSTNNSEGDYSGDNQAGVTLTDNMGVRQIRGITYAINIDNGLVTKYRYMDDAIYFTDPSMWVTSFPNVMSNVAAPTQRAPRVYSRLYHSNSLGQMRSAETLPPRTFNYLNPVMPTGNSASLNFMRSSFFIESPTRNGNVRDKSDDDYLIFFQNQQTLAFGVMQTTKFVRVFWASKSWTAEDKTILKRIRKVFAYITSSDDPTVLRGVVHTSPEGTTATADITWQYTYTDTRPLSPRFNYSVTGELQAVPLEAAGQASSPSQNRGERHSFFVEGSGAFQMEYFGFYWKPINTYER